MVQLHVPYPWCSFYACELTLRSRDHWSSLFVGILPIALGFSRLHSDIWELTAHGTVFTGLQVFAFVEINFTRIIPRPDDLSLFGWRQPHPKRFEWQRDGKRTFHSTGASRESGNLNTLGTLVTRLSVIDIYFWAWLWGHCAAIPHRLPHIVITTFPRGPVPPVLWKIIVWVWTIVKNTLG